MMDLEESPAWGWALGVFRAGQKIGRIKKNGHAPGALARHPLALREADRAVRDVDVHRVAVVRQIA